MTEHYNLSRICNGDEEPVIRLWQAFGPALRHAARRYLSSGRPFVDSEDIANAAFMSFVNQLRDHSFTDEHPPAKGEECDSAFDTTIGEEGKDGIWPIALAIARNKALEANRRERAQKRGGDRQRVQLEAASQLDEKALEPHLDAFVNEQLNLLGDYVLDKPVLNDILHLRLQGVTSEVIAEKLKMSTSSVSRRLSELRRVLEEASGESSGT